MNKEFLFSCDELCNIIRECKLNSVEKFVGLGLNISFFDVHEVKVSPPSPLPETDVNYLVDDEDKQEVVEEASSEFIDIEDELTSLYIEDPSRFEEIISNPEGFEKYEKYLEGKK